MENAPIILAVLLTLGVMMSAWKYGVTKQLAGSISASAGVAAGIITFSRLPALLDTTVGLKFSPTIIVVIAFIAGLIVLVILRLILGALFRFLFNADSPLHNLADGPMGALVSLIPAAILLFVMGTGIRMIGTLMEMRQIQHVTRPGVNYVKSNYPKWPVSTVWRDGVEKIPFASQILDVGDPVSRKPSRNLAGLLIASQNQALMNHLKSIPETGPITTSSAFAGLEGNGEIVALKESHNRPKLLMNPALHEAGRTQSIFGPLNDLKLRKVIDDYMLSAEKMEDAKSKSPFNSNSKPTTNVLDSEPAPK